MPSACKIDLVTQYPVTLTIAIDRLLIFLDVLKMDRCAQNNLSPLWNITLFAARESCGEFWLFLLVAAAESWLGALLTGLSTPCTEMPCSNVPHGDLPLGRAGKIP